MTAVTKYITFSLLILAAVLTSLSVCDARRHAPIINGEMQPRKPRAAECIFGRQVRELGSTWFADLGPPFGVMYCIRCECVAIQKKRRVVGKVHCRNIKHDCPKPTCDEPVLLPGRCCKICPQDFHNPDFAQDVAPPPSNDEEEKNFKYMAALLTGRTTLEGGPPDRSDLVATGRFAFHRRSLYYSFYSTSRPRGVQFMDLKGNIIEEQALSSSLYQNATGKVCGVWRRIPREYRRLIREEKLIVSLLWERADLAVSGQLYRHRTLSTEMFSSLMIGTEDGSGGTAIVSVSTTTPSIHLTLIFNGVFTPTEYYDVPINVQVHTHDKNNLIIDEVVRVEKPSAELNVIEVSAAVSSVDIKLLSRHKLFVTISSRSEPKLRLTGRLVTRAACELHQALVAPTQKDPESGSTPSAAAAWVFIDSDGAIRYFIKLSSLPQPAVIALVIERRLLELEDLTPSVTGNWANGTLDRPSPKHLEQLYAGELGINIATRLSRSVARGKLTSRHVADARDSGAPHLLLPTDKSPSQTVVSMAWASIDNDCNLHYDVAMAGPNVDQGDYELYLSEVPLVAPGAPVSRRLLEPFSGNILEGTTVALLPGDLARIDSGMVHLEIQDASSQTPILRADWHKLPVPGVCLPHYSDNDVGVQGEESSVSGGDNASPPVCYHDGRFHQDGTQWSPDPCLICHCSLGVSKCDTIVCPEPQPGCILADPLPNQCCPICNNVSKEVGQLDNYKEGCTMAGHFHPAGSSWHPYLPPNGFDTCTHCYCHVGSLKVSCKRMECPKLACDERTAFRPHRKACCKVCPAHQPTPTNKPSHIQGDQGREETSAEILAAGGCSYPVGGPYPNGHEWHPRLYSHGELKCVNCRCKDGVVKCERKRCTRYNCNDECCIGQCPPRGRRHARTHH